MTKISAPMFKRQSPAVIIDIDGMLADCDHRRHFVTGPKQDWRSFNESMVTFGDY